MSPGSSTVVSSPDVAVEAMPLAVQLIPSTACLFFSYLDWSQFCQSWCLHCPEWLCLSGSGLGALHFSPVSLCPSTFLSSLTSLYFALSLPLPFCSIFSTFLTLFWQSASLAQPYLFFLNSCSTPSCGPAVPQQCHIGPCQTYGERSGPKAGSLQLQSASDA